MSDIRPMELDDLGAVADQLYATINDAAARGAWPSVERTDTWDERAAVRMRYQLTTDPGGCWVADAGADGIVGHAIAIRRRHLWGLAMLHVLPSGQSAGTGRRLLAAALSYGRDAEGGIITSSEDPRAMRLYATSGFALRPGVEAAGPVHQAALRPAPDVREATVDDLALTVAVDELVRGAPHGEGGADIAAMLDIGASLSVMDADEGRGYVCMREGHVMLLAATTPAAAQQLLWHGLATAGDEAATIWGITGAQQWAIEVAYAAGLTVKPGGPVLTRGRVGPLTPYLPSGQYL
jgi:GNAT superfamily N-acetyltransferase